MKGGNYAYLVFFVLLFTLMPKNAYADWFYNSNNVQTEVEISSEATVIPMASYYKIEQVSINLTFFPRQLEHQNILNIYTKPEAEINDNYIRFFWEHPDEKLLSFYLRAGVETKNNIPEIKTKIKFPIEGLPSDVVKYIEPSVTIDSEDEEISKIASELAEGEDDLYVVAHKIADWTKNNINYNLSTLTADVSQKASWVLENKKGVCDELTSLFIAMLRSLGVPARFVSGVAYTDSELFPEQWGPHGWAEVYFPGYGWVPFDVTYGQYGYVDPTHIKFKESIDPDEPATYYNWLARNVELDTKELDIKVKKLAHKGIFDYRIAANVSIERGHVSFGSYNLIESVFENLNDYYISTEIYLSKPYEVQVYDSTAKSILLSPGEKKSVFWMVKVNEDLDRRLIYTMPIVVSLQGINASAYFDSSIKGSHYSYEIIGRIMEDRREERLKTYSANINFSCITESTEFYYYEDKKVLCSIKNLGNVFLEKLYVCTSDECRAFDIGISQQKNANFTLIKQAGINNLAISAKNNLVSKTVYIEYNVLDEPKIVMENVSYPGEVKFDDKFTISFIAAKNSSSLPLDINIAVSQNGRSRSTSLRQLDTEHDFLVQGDANHLKEGLNSYYINISYKDRNGRDYAADYSFSISLQNLTIGQKARLKMNQIGYNLAAMDIRVLVMFFVMALVVFILVLGYAFRPSTKKEERKEI